MSDEHVGNSQVGETKRARAPDGWTLVGIPAPSSGVGFGLYRSRNKTKTFSYPFHPFPVHMRIAPISIAADFSLHEALYAPWSCPRLGLRQTGSIDCGGKFTEETTQ